MNHDKRETEHEYDLPKQLLSDLKSAGILQDDAFDKAVLEAISYIWCKRPYLYMQLSRFPMKERYNILRGTDLNRLERWLYSRIMSRRYIPTKSLLREIEHYLNIKPSKKVIQTIKKIRKMVHDDRYRYRFGKSKER
jgi:hypothetical protein